MNIKIENLNLSKKTSIITGGAGHLGMCIADKLSLCGSNLILIDLDEKSLNKAKKKLEKKNRIKVRTFPLDLTNKKERIDCIKLIKKEYKVIDIMVNSIGMVPQLQHDYKCNDSQNLHQFLFGSYFPHSKG